MLLDHVIIRDEAGHGYDPDYCQPALARNLKSKNNV